MFPAIFLRARHNNTLAAMKARDFINRRITPIMILMLACVVAFAAIVFVAADTPSLAFLPLVPFVALGACIVYLHYGVRCSSCRGQLFPLAYLPRGGYFRISAAVRFCPFCGLSLDAEVDENGRPVVSRTSVHRTAPES